MKPHFKSNVGVTNLCTYHGCRLEISKNLKESLKKSHKRQFLRKKVYDAVMLRGIVNFGFKSKQIKLYFHIFPHILKIKLK